MVFENNVIEKVEVNKNYGQLTPGSSTILGDKLSGKSIHISTLSSLNIAYNFRAS